MQERRAVACAIPSPNYSRPKDAFLLSSAQSIFVDRVLRAHIAFTTVPVAQRDWEARFRITDAELSSQRSLLKPLVITEHADYFSTDPATLGEAEEIINQIVREIITSARAVKF